MRTETITKTYVQFNELNEDQKNKVIENFNHDGFLYEHCLEERIETLKALAKYCNDARLDYSLSCVPSRGEFISIKPRDYDGWEDNNLEYHLKQFITEKQDCPLTGVCYDEDLRDGLKKHGPTIDGLNQTLNDYIDSIHNEYESMLTIEYIGDLCEANEYEFDLDTLKLS